MPRSGPVIVLGLPTGGEQANDERYPIAVLGEGFEGLLVSESTRIPGLVSVADVAPTALGREDGLASESAEEAAAQVLELDARIRDNRVTGIAATLLAGDPAPRARLVHSAGRGARVRDRARGEPRARAPQGSRSRGS